MLIKQGKTNIKYLLIVVILAAIVGGGFYFYKNYFLGGFCGWAEGNCESEDDCFETGCSGQVCASEGVITTCEARGCYNNEAYGLYCTCFNGECKWRKD